MKETEMNPNNNPLSSLDVWEDDLLQRYPDPETIAREKTTEEYRNYEDPARDSVKEFYRLNHTYQTYDFVQQKKAEFLKFDRKEMSVWNAFDFLNQLVDDSDPDTDLDQFQHLLQTSEAIRADGHPDWMVLAGLFHDMGKVLCLFDEPQWAVVGDTFQSAAPTRTRSFTRNSFRPTRITTTRSIKQNMAYIHMAADCAT